MFLKENFIQYHFLIVNKISETKLSKSIHIYLKNKTLDKLFFVPLNTLF